MMKAYTHGQGKTRDVRAEPCLHKASALAHGQAHTTHQRKLCYKRAFAVKEWVGLVRGGVIEDFRQG